MKKFPPILVVVLLVLLIFGVFPFLNFALADETPPGEGTPPEEEECSPCPCGGYYYCAGGCGGTLHYVTPGDPCCDGECEDTIVETCSSWQMCDASIPGCRCEGSCLQTPKNPRYYNNPTYSDQPDKNIGNSDIKLPVKLDWDDVAGWGQPDGPQSYVINIENTSGAFPKTLNISEFIPESCTLKSNSTHPWQVKACCSAAGTNCGPPSNWSFTTNLAPEPVSPYDTDWTGAAGAENTEVPTTLDWCDVAEADSLILRVYVIQGGQKICHPNLLTTKEGQEFCEPWIIRKTRRDPQQPDKLLYSDFPDEDRYFFTKDTTYLWEVATCLDDSGIDCKDYSQQWTFTTGEAAPTETLLVSPPDDPEGQKPVGLPLILDWQKELGMNSWWYKIGSTQEFTNTSQSRSLDYPELSLNTFYQWQVLSCWDYQGEEGKCKDAWSEVYTFKTTGQPPTLTYPASGATDIPIPVNFDWQDVGGAKSYIINIQGDGLNMNEPVAESSFSLDFPEFPIHQETDYAWQVKTCAHENGQVCLDNDNRQTFTTFRLPPPQNPSCPENNGLFFTDEHFLSWEKVTGAKAYQYQIRYLSLSDKETDETCFILVGKEMFEQPKTTLTNSGFAELICLGQYGWQVRSCLDESCQETSNWSNLWTFNFLEGGTGQGGLVPCGRATDNLNTPFWNERDPCQIKHLFLLVKIIIDFLLLRAAPLILVLLTVATAVIFFTSLGQIITMARVKALWRAAGIGLVVVFLAWIIVNLLLGLIGYNIGVFGNWYKP
jgi:hypothetical protein